MSVSAIFVSITVNSGKKIVLEKVPCIYYLFQIQERQKQGKALLNSGSKVNTIGSAYIEKLGLKTRKTNVGAQKIDSSVL